MWSGRPVRKFRQGFLIGLLLGVIGFCLWTCERNSQATEKESELSSLILSKAELTPPLRTPLKELRFSSDGNYILAQDGSTIYILSRSPFAIRYSIEAHDALPARFSADSQLLLIPTKIGVQGRTLTDNKIKFQITFSPDKACYQAGLSPDGEFYTCLDETLRLQVFQVFAQEKIYDYQYPYWGDFYLRWPPPGPDWTLHALPVRIVPTVQFSQDSRYLIVALWWEVGIALDLRTRKPINLTAKVRIALASRTLFFLAPDKVAYADQPNLSRLTILSFPDGHTLNRLTVAGRPAPGENANYFLEYTQGSQEIRVMDTSKGAVKTLLSGERADVSPRGEAASYEKGRVSLFDLSRSDAIAEAVLPAGLLSDLRTAVVSPELQSIAASVPNDGGIYDIQTGKLATRLDGFRGAWFQSDQTCYLEVPLTRGNTMEMLRLDADSGQGAKVWKRNESWLNPRTTGQIQLLENALSGPVVLRSRIEHKDDLRYPFTFHIDATGTSDGKHLWTRWNQYVISAPFQDTQGDRVVLGSLAKEAKYEGTVKETLRKQRKQEGEVHLYAQDSFFEVLDGRSGKTVGGILDQRGGGPFQVDEGFSVGDWVVLVKDGKRIIVFSLSTGKEVMRAFGNYATISVETGSLALTKDGYHVEFYNLSTGLQVQEVEFPRRVVYLHFSVDGQRLLVLTENQSIYTLNVSSITASTTSK